MADEQIKPPYKKPSIIPEGYDWPSFQNRDGSDLENNHCEALAALGTSGGMLGIIFRKAQNRIQDPAKLNRQTSLTVSGQTTQFVYDGDGNLIKDRPG